MQVLENNDPGPFGCQAFHEVSELAKHAFSRRSEHLVLECGTIFVAKQARHLRQPCRRVIAKRLEQQCAISATTSFVQRLDQRQESLMGSEQLIAAAMQHTHSALLHPLQGHLDKRCLADPGLTSDEDDLTLSGQYLLQHAFQNLQRTGPPDPPTPALIGQIFRGVGSLLKRLLAI